MSSTPSPVPDAPRRTRRKEARPGELLDAALALFVEKGFAATRVEEVAARAGVSKGTLFLYFPSKEELFKAVVHENAGRHVADAFREMAGFTGSSAELLREFVRRWWTQYGGTPAAGLTKLMVSEAANFPELAQYYQDEVVGPSHELLRRVVQRGIDSGEFRPVDVPPLVHLIIAPLVQMVTWRYSLAPCCPSAQQIDPVALLELHAEMMVRGLK
ncbi:TetR/AcrR family transcriptional regulator [Ottowia sp.]|jgi:TetR/AcrR family transcriptional regulator|uniref:TetR/AcrR family transcriptional regulator n=1 Tax=Ottowia sp. TaxID=1898956 RepID=UPI0025EC88A2|nr:TetR/AcrR family transcriptional regulator [Ottowia sp.]MBK6612543.1 TetR/AcrR family transcriptional regulator [Ottowia sp.]MBK6748303.1 TetR/AcrR family transcriptional regulator [Ottowia sp.]